MDVFHPERIVRTFKTLDLLLKFVDNFRPCLFIAQKVGDEFKLEYHYGDSTIDKETV